MSLINDALRKAQRERDRPGQTGGLPDHPWTEEVMPPPLPEGGRKTLSKGMVLGAAATAVLASVLILFFNRTQQASPAPEAEPAAPATKPVVQPKETVATVEPPTESSQPAPATTPAETPAAPAAAASSGTPASAPATAQPAVAATVGAETAPAPAANSTPVAAAPAPAAPTATAPAAAPAVAAAKPAATEAETPAPTIGLLSESQLRSKKVVDSLRISSMRGSGANIRVMIGGRLYRAGDIVESTIGLRLERISDGRVVFSDPTGYEFTVAP